MKCTVQCGETLYIPSRPELNTQLLQMVENIACLNSNRTDTVQEFFKNSVFALVIQGCNVLSGMPAVFAFPGVLAVEGIIVFQQVLLVRHIVRFVLLVRFVSMKRSMDSLIKVTSMISRSSGFVCLTSV